MNIQPSILPELKMSLDWREYYKSFAEAHGGTPIVHQERQLFQDGWMYSLSSYSGPEWPPPEDPKELVKLQQVYWNTRWNRARIELEALKGRYEGLRGLQDNKSQPLQQTLLVKDPETGKTRREVTPWNPKLFETLIRILEADVQEADSKLKALKENTNEPGTTSVANDAAG